MQHIKNSIKLHNMNSKKESSRWLIVKVDNLVSVEDSEDVGIDNLVRNKRWQVFREKLCILCVMLALISFGD